MSLDISNTPPVEEEEIVDDAMVSCPNCGEVDWEFWTEVKALQMHRHVRLLVDEVPQSLVDEDNWITDSDENAKRLSPNHISDTRADVCTCESDNPEVVDIIEVLRVVRIECSSCGHIPRIEQSTLDSMYKGMSIC